MYPKETTQTFLMKFVAQRTKSSRYLDIEHIHPGKFNMFFENDSFKKVTPFKNIAILGIYMFRF